MISKGRKDYISYLHWGKGMTLRSLLLMKTLSTCAKKKKRQMKPTNLKLMESKEEKSKVNGIYHFKVMAYQAIPTKVMN